MSYHKLLQKQINKHIPEEFKLLPGFENFIQAINESYLSFERDKELLNHAFNISEKEYQLLYQNLNHEYDLKTQSIDNLKSAIKNIEKDNDSNYNLENDDILEIVEYINSEIQKRKETETNLNRTLKLLTTLLSNLNSGILVVDEHRKILYTNQLFCNMLLPLSSPEIMTGMDCTNFIEQSKINFQNPEIFTKRIEEILDKKISVFADELKLVDGRILERDYIPIYIDNKYKGHLWDYTDITERKNFENKLLDLTIIQNAILNGTDYSIIYTDTNGIIKSFNQGAENMLGYSANEIIDIHTPAIFHEIDEVVNKAKELSEELGYEIKAGFDVFIVKSRTQSAETNEWIYIKKNGDKINVQLSVTSIRNSENEIIGYLGIGRNITIQKLAEIELKLSGERYRNIVENSSDIIYKINKVGYFTYVNPVAERITGYTQEELISKHFTELVKDVYKKETLIFYNKQVKNKKPTTYYEFPITTKNGEEKWIGQSVQFSEGQTAEFELTALAIDITERKKYELQLIESNKNLELFKTLMNNSSDAIQVSKENGQLVYINHEASKRLGITTEDVSKYKVKDFEINFKNDKDWYQHVLKVRRKGSMIMEGENVNIDTNIIFPVEVTVRFLELNSVGYIIANSRDISERKQIEASIKFQKEKYQNIIANMNLGLLEVDVDENIQFVNPGFEYISGYKEIELIGKNAAKLFVSESHENIVKNKINLRKEGHSDMYEVPIKNKKGELKWWMISGAPNYDEKGNIIGSIGIHLDITEQKQLELDLELSKCKAEESSKAKEAFLANMSHEIRTPLNAIIGMIRELSKEKLTELQETYVQNTSIASQHLLSVLNNILDISKIEAGELQLDLHHFDLQKILNDVKSIMLAKCGEKGLYLKINHIENKNIYFIGDSSRFRQILLNLIGNSVKFTNSGGITVEYDVQDLHEGYQAVYISVKDTGVGMDESYLKNIFNKFSQEDSSTSRKYGGSGLGMSITKELIQLMNGVIEIKSKKNVGTTIHMKFLIPIGDSDKLIKDDFTEIASAGKLLNVLLVEDNEFNRLVAGNTLNHFNCIVTEAINGLEAINILKTGKKFDVILMDLQMPIMDGFESTKIIRNELKINTPIIALTANAFKSELEQCINIGMNDCVTKPFEEEKLLNSIYKVTNLNSDNTHTGKTVIQNNDKLYNLHQLRIVSRNDDEYCKKMIGIFIEHSTLSVAQITESYLEKDLSAVYAVAHRIKPSLDLMGIETLKEPIRFIERNAKELKDSEELGKQIEILFFILNKVIIQLKVEEN
jgi:PAS domain S-box-containing protein